MAQINDELIFEIKSIFDNKGFSEFKNNMKDLSQYDGKQFSDLEKTTKELSKFSLDDIIVSPTTFKNEIKETTREMSDFANAMGMPFDSEKGIEGLLDIFKNVEKETKSLEDIPEKLKTPWQQFFDEFNFGFMSVMFMSQRMVKTLTKSIMTVTGLYTQLTQNTTEASAALTGLSAGFTMLKFSIGEALGQALLPMLPTILDIIETITNWIDENQELAASLVLGTLAFFGFLLVLSQTFLFLSGLINVAKQFIILFKGIPTVAAGLKIAFAGIGASIFWLIALFAFLIVAWQENIGNFKDNINIYFESMKSYVLQTIKDLLRVGESLFGVFKAILEGDAGELLRNLGNLVIDIIGLVLKVLLGVVRMAHNAFNISMGLLYGLMFNFANLATDLFNKFFLWIAEKLDDVVNFFLEKVNWLREKLNMSPIVLDIDSKTFVKNLISTSDEYNKIAQEKMLSVFDSKNFDGFYSGAIEGLENFHQKIRMVKDEVSDVVEYSPMVFDGELGFSSAFDPINTSLEKSNYSIDLFNTKLSQIPFDETFPKTKSLTDGFSNIDQSILFLNDSIFDKEKGLINALDSVANITEDNVIPATESLIQTNYTEAESWRRKTEEVNRYYAALSRKSTIQRSLGFSEVEKSRFY